MSHDPTVPGGPAEHPHPLVELAAQQLHIFGGDDLDRVNADRLLSFWVHYHLLTAEQIDEVTSRFPAATS